MHCGLYAILALEGIFYYAVNFIFASKTSQGLLMKQSGSKHERQLFASLYTLKKPAAPQNESKNFAYTHPYTHQTTPCPTATPGSVNPHPNTHQTTPQTTPCLTASPKTNPQNLRMLTPILEIRTPIYS